MNSAGQHKFDRVHNRGLDYFSFLCQLCAPTMQFAGEGYSSCAYHFLLGATSKHGTCLLVCSLLRCENGCLAWRCPSKECSPSLDSHQQITSKLLRPPLSVIPYWSSFLGPCSRLTLVCTGKGKCFLYGRPGPGIRPPDFRIAPVRPRFGLDLASPGLGFYVLSHEEVHV